MQQNYREAQVTFAAYEHTHVWAFEAAFQTVLLPY